MKNKDAKPQVYGTCYDGWVTAKRMVDTMPLYQMKEIWTPFKLIGIKFFRSEDHHVYIKIWNNRRRMIK